MGALPTEERVRKMTDGDYLYCILHLLIDQEEELDRLCPVCRGRAEEERCPGCGVALATWQGGDNGSFDEERFRRLSRQ